MFALIKEVNTTIKLLLVLVKLLNQAFISNIKEFTININHRMKLLVLDTKISLARARRGL